MNKIYKLFDEKYVRGMFLCEILPRYDDFVDVKRIKIHTYKKHIWEHTYHVVIKYTTTFLTRNGKKKRIPIVCSAHSSEPRANVYKSLQFLWSNGFGRGLLTIPHPLYYSKYFRGTFYRGVEGNNLYYYIKGGDKKTIEEVIDKTSRWFVKLHSTSIKNAINFNEENSRIETVFPGIDHILLKIKEKYPQLLSTYKKVYKILNENEKKFLSSTDERWLVHGDAHPENIIKMGRKKIGVIDFTDLSLADFARDIGSFTQQLEYMINRKMGDSKYAEEIKNRFIENYFKVSKEKFNENVKKRIDNYYNWTAIRTSTFFMIKHDEEPKRGIALLKEVTKKLKIPFNNIKKTKKIKTVKSKGKEKLKVKNTKKL